MKNSLQGLNHIFEHAQERISELEDKLIEIMKSEEQKGKKTNKE